MANNEKQMPNNQQRKLYSNEETVERARAQIGNKNYAIFEEDGKKNCEGQSRKAKTGVAESKQVTNLKDGFALGIATGVALAIGGPLGGALVVAAALDEKSKKQPKVVRAKPKPKSKRKEK